MMQPWNCCRICLLVDSLNPIFSIPSESEKYTEILLKTTGIKIELNDSYPQEMCVQCINFINQCIKFRLLAKSTQKSLTERSNNQNTFNLKAEPTEERKLASIDISEYLEPSKSDTCEVNYDVDIEKVETSDDNTENLVVFVSEIQDIPEKSVQFTFDAETPRKRVKKTKVGKIKKPTRKRVTHKKHNLENNQQSENTSCEENTTNEGKDTGTKTETQDKKTRVKETIECEYCHKILTSKLSLRNHYKIHTGFDVVCEHCGKKFITRRLLLMHCRAKHGYEKTDKCSYCDYRASNAEQVKIHERLHTGEKPYACQECGAGFHRKSSYLQHIAIHLPEKTVQCEQCPALFKSVTLMRIHASRHKRPSYQYRCRVCAGAFARKRNVVRHLQRIHALAGAPAHVERVKIT